MKKFNVIVTRRDEYTIELDENIINEEWMKEFSKHFHDVNTLQQVAEALARYQVRNGEEDFFEGYGYVKRNGDILRGFPGYNKETGQRLSEGEDKRQPAAGINIIIEDEDNDIECETEEKE